MFKEKEATHPLIYADIVANHVFLEKKTIGEMEKEIDTLYRQRVEAYGLAWLGFYENDQISRDLAEKGLTEFFNKKLKK